MPIVPSFIQKRGMRKKSCLWTRPWCNLIFFNTHVAIISYCIFIPYTPVVKEKCGKPVKLQGWVFKLLIQHTTIFEMIFCDFHLY